MFVIPYFENIIQGPDREMFLAKTKQVAKQLNINPNWLLLVMNSETGSTFSASIQNPYSGAVGLIQFMPQTAAGLGTSTYLLSKMSRLQQLDYVLAYYQKFIKNGYKIKSYEDLYLLTFYPYALNKPDSFIFGSEVSQNRAKLIRQQNNFDYNNDSVISKGEFKKWIYRSKVLEKIPKNQQKYLKARKIKTWHILAGATVLGAAFITIKILV